MPKKGPYAKGIAKREEILDTALDVFAEKGYRRASLRQIAEAVGLSQAGLLHHFSSKEELFSEVLRKRDEVDVRIADSSEHDALGEDPFGTLVDVVRRNAQVPGLVQLYATVSVDAADDDHPGHDYFVSRYRDFIAQLENHVRAEQSAGRIDATLDARQIARIGIAVADGMQVQWMLDDQADMAQAIEYFWSLVTSIGRHG